MKFKKNDKVVLYDKSMVYNPDGIKPYHSSEFLSLGGVYDKISHTNVENGDVFNVKNSSNTHCLLEDDEGQYLVMNETVKRDVTGGTGKVSIGDVVRTVQDIDCAKFTETRHGEVVDIIKDGSDDINYGIEFQEKVDYGHNCNNFGEDKCCWYFEADEIEIDSKIKRDDIVKFISDSGLIKDDSTLAREMFAKKYIGEDTKGVSEGHNGKVVNYDGHIALVDIGEEEVLVYMKYIKLVSRKPSGYEMLKMIESDSKKGKFYYIKRNFTNGKISCNCPSWIYNNGMKKGAESRVCKHIEKYMKENSEDVKTKIKKVNDKKVDVDVSGLDDGFSKIINEISKLEKAIL